MTAETPARGPLEERLQELATIATSTGGTVVLEHVPFLAQVDLRVGPAHAALAPYPLPPTPDTAHEEGGRAALWLGPDEWLILGRPHAGGEIATELERAFAGVHHSIVDVSANRVALEIGGPGGKDLLSAGCSLDLHPRSWTEGRCAQTMLAKAQVILHERSETTGILVRPSFAGYLLDWILAAAVSFVD